MKSILFVVVMLAPSFAQAGKPYYRFWQGWKRANLSHAQFRAELERTFIPATVDIYKGRGGWAYLPVIMPHPRNRSGVGLPDEIALVGLQSQAAYQKVRATQAGKDYGALHWTVFRKGKSKSTVPEPFRGKIKRGHAYDMMQSQVDWQKGWARYSIRQVRSAKALSRYAKTRARTPGLRSYVVLYSDAGLWIEYELWKNQRAFRLGKDLNLTPVVSGHLPLRSPYHSGVGLGEGMNARF